MENGVWRTVGGRRIFIKDGEDLETAMKKSGKFKGSKKKTSDEELKEKYMNISQEERVKAYEEGKNWKDLVKEKDKARSIKSQQSDIEKASGLKVEKSFETDLYGNGKEDRFELSNGTMITHTTESMGQKVDRWGAFTIENGSIKSNDFKSYEEMIKHLKGSK